MAFFDTRQRRRWRKLRGKLQKMRRGFWRKLQRPQTWKFIVKVGYFIYRIYRLMMWVFELFV
jgi:uncharacterized protein YpuA (DUF1002 family)